MKRVLPYLAAVAALILARMLLVPTFVGKDGIAEVTRTLRDELGVASLHPALPPEPIASEERIALVQEVQHTMMLNIERWPGVDLAIDIAVFVLVLFALRSSARSPTGSGGRTPPAP